MTPGPTVMEAGVTKRADKLRTLPNPGKTFKPYQVTIETDELTFVGKRAVGENRSIDQRDFAKLTVTYVPWKLILELKSFKEYVGDFAAALFSYERICNTIFDELHDVLTPQGLSVAITCHPRGGASTTVSRTTRKE